MFSQPDRYTLSMNVEALQDGKWVRVAHAGPPDAELGVNFCITFEPVTTTATSTGEHRQHQCGRSGLL